MFNILPVMDEQRKAPALLAEEIEGEAMERKRVAVVVREPGSLCTLQRSDGLLMLVDAAFARIQRAEEGVEG